MARRTPQIQPLPPETIAQIKSSTIITSLNGVVVELVKNSLDAGATKIDVSIDFRRGACSVTDNGSGILKREFMEDGGLGRLHHSSKLQSPPSHQHGHKGAFLSSLAGVSLLSITSRHRDEPAHNTITIHHTRPIVRLVPAADNNGLPSGGGTRVTVHDLFGNLPVRVKQRPNDEHDTTGKEWDDMTSKLTGVLLAWLGDVSLSAELKGSKRKWALRPSSSRSKVSPGDVATSSSFDVYRILTILSQTGHILPSNFSSWAKASARTPLVSIQAAISLQPAPMRNIQFISFGISPVESLDDIGVLFEEVNRIFAASTFGAPSEPEIDDVEKSRRLQDRRFKKCGTTNEQLRGGGKSVDRWPMFYVRIELERQDSNPLDDVEAAFDSSRSLQTILHVLNALFVQFLQENNFRPHVRRPRRTQGVPKSSRYSTPAQNDPSAFRKDSSQALATESLIRSADSLPQNVSVDLPKPSHDPVHQSDIPRRSRHQAKEDFMNTTVRLPSFARSKKTLVGNEFDSWTRIKGGCKAVLEDICSGLPRSNKSTEAVKVVPQQTTTRSKVQEKHLALMQPGIGKVRGSTPSQQTPRLSGSHQLETIFRPAESTESTEPEKEDYLFEEPSSTTGTDERNELPDEIIPWKNPITQMTVLINARTGLVLQQAPRPSSAGSLSSGQGLARPPSARSLKPSVGRPRTSRSSSSLSLTPRPNSWIGGLLRDWENPVFRQAEPRLHSLCQDDLQFPLQQDGSTRRRGSFQDMRDTFEATMPTFRGNLSKQSLKQAEVIAQVDQKFILVTIAVDNADGETEKNYKRVLVLIDQHAADERCRIEKLFDELFSSHFPDTSSTNNGRRECVMVPSTVLGKPIHFQLSHKELHLFERNRQYLREWGIHYRISKGSSTSNIAGQGHLVSVTALPSLIAERCRVEPKLLIDLLRTEVWARVEGGKRTSTASTTNKAEVASQKETTTVLSQERPSKEGTGAGAHVGPTWLRHIGSCPQGIIDMLNSRSCRTAIMFNDVLSADECTTLVSRLAECAFPFQCAHGRPSMVPLVELSAGEHNCGSSLVSGLTGKSFGDVIATNDMSFGRAYREWRSRGRSPQTG